MMSRVEEDRAKIVGELILELLSKLQEVDEILETLDIILDEQTYHNIMESIEEAKRGELYPIEQLLKEIQEEQRQQ